MTAQVGSNDSKVGDEGLGDSIPAPCVITAAVNEKEVGLAVVAPIPEVQLQAVRIVVL
jgi:hypothetical protein